MFCIQEFAKALPNVGVTISQDNTMRKASVLFCSLYLYTKEYPYDRVESCSFIITLVDNELTVSRGALARTIDTTGKKTIDVVIEFILLKFFNLVAELMGRELVVEKTLPLITHVDGMLFYNTMLIENMPNHYVMQDVMTNKYYTHYKDVVDFKFFD